MWHKLQLTPTAPYRTLRGEEPADLRSKALGLTIPETLLADEVIQ
jgi:hypothetical protein